jgi:hypothetical protein
VEEAAPSIGSRQCRIRREIGRDEGSVKVPGEQIETSIRCWHQCNEFETSAQIQKWSRNQIMRIPVSLRHSIVRMIFGIMRICKEEG